MVHHRRRGRDESWIHVFIVLTRWWCRRWLRGWAAAQRGCVSAGDVQGRWHPRRVSPGPAGPRLARGYIGVPRCRVLAPTVRAWGRLAASSGWGEGTLSTYSSWLYLLTSLIYVS